MRIDERDRDRIRKSLENELGREATEEEVAASYRKMNLYLQTIDLDRERPRLAVPGLGFLSSLFRF